MMSACVETGPRKKFGSKNYVEEMPLFEYIDLELI